MVAERRLLDQIVPNLAVGVNGLQVHPVATSCPAVQSRSISLAAAAAAAIALETSAGGT